MAKFTIITEGKVRATKDEIQVLTKLNLVKHDKHNYFIIRNNKVQHPSYISYRNFGDLDLPQLNLNQCIKIN